MKRSKTLSIMAIASATIVLAICGRSNGEDVKDILWYGNSFTNATCCGSSRSVPNIVMDIAVAAGHPAPRNVNASVDGQTMQWHLTNNTARITNGIAAGENWENVVLQDYSTWPTHIGNLAQHLSSTLSMYQLVNTRSPGVVPIMYETWARGPGHSVYAGASPDFPGGPPQMQQELRDGYHLSTSNINNFVGANLAKYAPAGDAWQNAGFPLTLYASDIYHGQNRGSLLNALILYGTIYGDPTTSDIPLSSVLTTLGISAADGAWLTGVADQTLGAVPEPAAVLLVAIGLFAIGGVRRRP